MSIKRGNIISSIKNEIVSGVAFIESLRFGIILAIIGGFLEIYTFVSRGGVFANAQTANLVLVAVKVAEKNYKAAVMPFAPLLSFIVGVLVAQIIIDKLNNNQKKYYKAEMSILIIEVIVLFIVGFIPTTVPNVIVTSIVSFVTSVQITCFKKLVDGPYTSTMCTVNIRTITESTYLALVKGDKKARLKAIRYGSIVGAFIIGACISAFLTYEIGIKSIWLCSIILLSTLFMLKRCSGKN